MRATSLLLLLLSCRGPVITGVNDCDGGACEVTCATSTVATDAGCQLVVDDLRVTPGALSPAFEPLRLAYVVQVPAGTTAVQVTATVHDATASVTINGQVGRERLVALVSDDQTVRVRVVRSFATTPTEQLVYSVRVLRQVADAAVSDDAGAADAGTPDASVSLRDAGVLDAGPPPSVRCGAGWPSDAGPFPRFTEVRLPGTFAEVNQLSPAGSTLLVAGSGWVDATIFERQGGVWVPVFTITDNPPIKAASFDHDGTLLAVAVPFDDVGCSQRRPSSWTGAVRLYRRGPAGWALEQCLTDTPRHPHSVFLSWDGARLLVPAFDVRPASLPRNPDRVVTVERSDGGWVALGEWRPDSGFPIRASPDLELIAQEGLGVPDFAWRWPGAALPALPAPPDGDSSLFVQPVSATRVVRFTGKYVDRGLTRSVRSSDQVDGGWLDSDTLVLDGGLWSAGFPGCFTARGGMLVQHLPDERLHVLERGPGGWRSTSFAWPDAGMPNTAFGSVDECLRTIAVTTNRDSAVIVDLGP